jgi:hypothetical protein
VVNALNASLLSGGPPTDLVRGFGLAALGEIGPLRRAAMRLGLGPKHSNAFRHPLRH